MNTDSSEGVAPPFLTPTPQKAYSQALILAAAYVFSLAVFIAAKAPMMFAYLLLFALPILTLLKPRFMLCFAIIILAISPLYMFFPGHLRGLAPDPYAQMVLNLGVLSLNFNGGMVLIYLLISLCAITVFKNTRGLKVMFGPFILFMGVFIVVWVFRAPTQQGIRSMTTFLVPAIFAAAVFASIRSQKHIKMLEKSILFAVPLAVGLALVCDFIGIRSAWKQPTLWSPVHRFVGASIAPHMAMYCLPPLALLLGKIKSGERNLWAYVALLVVVIALTVSRTAFFVAIFMILITILFLRRNKATAIIVGLSMVIMITVAASQQFLSRSVGIKTFGGKETIHTSGRLKLWEGYATMAMKKPWLGYGMGQDILFHEKYANTKLSVAHNDYLRLWFSSGIIGLGAYLFAYITFFRRIFKNGASSITKKTRWSALMVLLGFSLIAITDNPISLISFTIPTLTIIVIAIRAKELDTAQEKE